MCILTKLCPLFSRELLGSEVSWNVIRHKPLTLLYLMFNYRIINSWEHLQLENSDLGFGQVMLLFCHRNHAFMRFHKLLHVQFFHILSLQKPPYVTTTVNVDLEGFFCCHKTTKQMLHLLPSLWWESNFFSVYFFLLKNKFMHIIMYYTTHSYRY